MEAIDAVESAQDFNFSDNCPEVDPAVVPENPVENGFIDHLCALLIFDILQVKHGEVPVREVAHLSFELRLLAELLTDSHQSHEEVGLEDGHILVQVEETTQTV